MAGGPAGPGGTYSSGGPAIHLAARAALGPLTPRLARPPARPQDGTFLGGQQARWPWGAHISKNQPFPCDPSRTEGEHDPDLHRQHQPPAHTGPPSPSAMLQSVSRGKVPPPHGPQDPPKTR